MDADAGRSVASALPILADALQDAGCNNEDILRTAASIKNDVENTGGTYVNQEVCIDGNVITSRTPEDLPAFIVGDTWA